MKRKYFLKSPLQIAHFSRLLAKLIDAFIALILSILYYPVGIIFAVIYIAISDSLRGGQSVGKKFIGLAVISLADGTPCSVKQSTIRNLPLLIPLIFAILPIWGWVLSFIIGTPLILLEIYLIFKLDSGHRLGDVMADTSVMANDGNSVQIKKRKTSWYDDKSKNEEEGN